MLSLCFVCIFHFIVKLFFCPKILLAFISMVRGKVEHKGKTRGGGHLSILSPVKAYLSSLFKFFYLYFFLFTNR